MLIKKRYSLGDTVTHKGKNYEIASFLTEQTARKEVGGAGRARLLGYEKAEITVYRIHKGKTLLSSNKYIGMDYV